MLAKYIHKGKVWEQFRFRGSFGRLGKDLKNSWLELKKKQRLERENKTWVTEFENHIGKEVNVTTFYFESMLACSSKIMVQVGKLISIDEESGYCNVSINNQNNQRPYCVHNNCIELIKK